MKKIALLFAALALMLTGCMATDTSLTFNEDKTIDMNIVYSIIKNAGATDEVLMSIIEEAEAELEEREIDYSFSDDEDAYRITVPLRFDTVDELIDSEYLNTLRFIPVFSRSEEDGKLTLSLNENGDLQLSGTITPESSGIDAFFTQTGADPENASIKFSVSTPDGKSGQWEIKGGETAEVDFTAKNIYGESTDYTLITGIIAVIILIAAALICFVILRGKKKKTLPASGVNAAEDEAAEKGEEEQ